MRSLKQIKNLKGKRILLRAGFDVSVKNGKIKDDERIRALLPTMRYLMKKGPLIIISHQGRPKGKIVPSLSLKILVPTLEKLLKKKIKFAKTCLGNGTVDLTKSLKTGDVLLVENLRFNPGEEKNDQDFAKNLAKLGDIYVDDAFTNAHRKHASMISVPKYLPSYAGFQMEEEIKNLSHAFCEPKYPFLFILGGAKFETKLPLVEKYLKLADQVFVGGALANDFFKAMGYEVGKSRVGEKNFGIAKLLKNKKLLLPVDVIVKSGSKLIDKKVNMVKKDEIILDVGQDTIKMLAPLIKKSKLILWNGPLGKYEDMHVGKVDEKILKLVAASPAESIIGGGDTVAQVSKMKMRNKFSFISTGGGATLDFLANGTLPGIKALK